MDKGDVATLLVAALALAVAVWTAVWTRNTARRALYVDLESRLTDLDAQEGRRLLHDLVDEPNAPALIREREPEDFDKINRVMSLLNTLGSYVALRYVERDVVLRHWAPNIRNSWEKFEWWIAFRQGSDQVGDLRKFGDLIQLGRYCKAEFSPAFEDHIASILPGKDRGVLSEVAQLVIVGLCLFSLSVMCLLFLLLPTFGAGAR